MPRCSSTGASLTLLIVVVSNAFGLDFLRALSLTPPASIGLSFNPTYNELLTVAQGPSVFWALALGFTFLFWTYVWMPINYFTATRLMLALSLDGYLPRQLAKVHERYATPYIAIIVAFALGEASLILYVLGILSVITLLWAGVIMFGVTAIAAILYPTRLPDVWRANGGGTVGGIPTIRLWGVLLVPAVLLILYILWFDPSVGIGHSTLQMGLNIGLPVSGVLLFFGVLFVRRQQGVDVRLSATEIPPD